MRTNGIARNATLLALTLAGLLGEAAAVDAPITSDTFIAGEGRGVPRGERPDLRVGEDGSSAYLAFDLGTMPDGVSALDVAGASVRLYVRRVVGAGEVVARPVLDPWSESVLTRESAPALLDVEVARRAIDGSMLGKFLEIDVTDLARAWVEGTLPASGIALEAGSGAGSFVFDSKESVRGGHEPRMEITLRAAPGTDPGDSPLDLTGPTGPEGPAGPDGPAGAAGPPLNPKAVAVLRWQEANRTGAQFAAGAHPLSAVFEGGFVWATDFDEDKVTKIDPVTGAIVASYPVGDAPVNAASDSVNLWVLNFFGGTITRLALADGAPKGSITVGTGPSGIAFDGAHMWVANNASNTVMKIRAGDGLIVGTFPVIDAPRRVAFDGIDVWVTCSRSHTLVRMRASDGAILATYTGFSRPLGIAFDGSKMWVANFDGATISAVRVADGATVHTIPIGAQPFEVAFDGRAVWVPNAAAATVTKIRAADGVILGTYATGSVPEGVAFDGARIWVANSQSNTLSPF